MSPSSPPSPITTPSRRRRRTSLGDFNQLLGLDGVVPLTSGDIPEGSEAVLYLRVSTARQMNTAIDIDEGGESSATQREVAALRIPVEVAVGSGDVSLTPVESAKTPPERNSEGACSNKMSVVGTTGLEPAISCSQSRRASHYATSRVPF